MRTDLLGPYKRLRGDVVTELDRQRQDAVGLATAGQSEDQQCGSVGWLSVKQLADKHQVGEGALRKRLERWRKDHNHGWKETLGASRNEARFLFEESAVIEIIHGRRSGP